MRLLCVGDIAITYHGTPTWLPPLDIIPRDDVRILFNWELPIGETLNPIPRSSGPRILSHPDSVKAIQKWAPGFASLATNHILDGGEEELTRTLDVLHQAGFQTTGAGRSADEVRKPLFWETSEGRLAIVNWVFPETHPEGEVVPGPYCWPGLDVAKQIIRALKQQADWVFIFPHWSDEAFSYPRPEDREIAEGLIKAGADIIIGHHPHVVRGLEMIAGNAVFYSLGNFYFSEMRNQRGDWIFKPVPRSREALAILVTLKNGRKPLVEALSYWQGSDQTKPDTLNRAVRRMKNTSRPLMKYSGEKYRAWYLKHRRFFNQWEYRLAFSLWNKGWKSTILYPLKILSRRRTKNAQHSSGLGVQETVNRKTLGKRG